MKVENGVGWGGGTHEGVFIYTYIHTYTQTCMYTYIHMDIYTMHT